MRMAKDGRYSKDQGTRLLEELGEIRLGRVGADGKPPSWARMAEQIGIPDNTLSEVRNGKYKGNIDHVLAKIDQFIADEQSRAGRYDDRHFKVVTMTRKIKGTEHFCIKHNSIAVVIIPSGGGKSKHATALAAERPFSVLIRVDEAHRDQRGVSYLLCEAIRELRYARELPHRERVRLIREWLQSHGTVVIYIDEAQKLVADGLELVRDLHDSSDLTGQRNTPFMLFGDADFYKLILRGQAGNPGPIKPQMTRRMYPIVDLESETQSGDGGKYSVDDIVRILRNDRLRVVDESGVRWIRALANVPGFGALGFAMAVLRMAFEVSSGGAIGVAELTCAIELMRGPKRLDEINEAAGGELRALVG